MQFGLTTPSLYNYGYVIVASWLVLMTVWVLSSFTAKREASRGSRIVRWIWQLLLLGLLIYALRNPYDDGYVLKRTFFNFGPAVGWVGALLTVAGVVLAVWARYRLGRNWGTHPKEDHELVTSGPYAYVRHPIYAGAMLALFGSALTGSISAVVLFVIGIFFCLHRVGREERRMLNLFPGQFPTYQARTKQFIPFVW